MRQVEAVRKPKLQEEAMSIAEQLITKGRQEGHQEGRQEGMLQGEMKTLLKILNKRFGSVSQTIKKQISTATASQLETWIDASLDADSLQQIFKA
jgi:flagellar biosynthesis/type III secretory pathway protein FliH